MQVLYTASARATGDGHVGPSSNATRGNVEVARTVREAL